MADVLGSFEQAVLVSIVRLGSDAYGRRVLAEVEARLSREVAAGAVYATLDRLEAKGLVTSRLAAGTPERGGRARRYYTLSAAGVRSLNASKAASDNMWRGLGWPLKGRT
jgi:DNA-binding PadR family transcriptional regulator